MSNSERVKARDFDPKRRTVVKFTSLLPFSMAISKTLWATAELFDDDKADKMLHIDEATSWNLADLKANMFEHSEQTGWLPTPEKAVKWIWEFIVAIFKWWFEFVTTNPEFKAFLQNIRWWLVSISKKLPWLLKQLADKTISAAKFLFELWEENLALLLSYLRQKLKYYLKKYTPQFLKDRYAAWQAIDREGVRKKIQEFAMKIRWITNVEEFLQMLWKVTDAEKAHLAQINKAKGDAVQDAFSIQYK